MDAAQIARALGGSPKHPAGFTACCPAHDDHNPSLSIDDSDNGGVLVKCWAGCTQDAVISALKARGLWDSKGKQDTAPQVKPKVVGRYYYRDQTGTILYWKERLEPGKNGKKKYFRFRHTDPATGKDEFGHGKHNPHVLYNLDKIAAASTIHFHEGEGKADIMTEWGLVGTSLDCGAQSSLDESLQHALDALEGKNVALYPDNHGTGSRYMETVAAYLYGKAKLIKFVHLPGRPDKGDIVDWIKTPGNDKKRLIQCMTDAPYWEPSAQPEALQEATAHEAMVEQGHKDEKQFPLRSGRELRALDIKVEWIVEGLIPRGSVVLLYGRGGIGKTTLMMMLSNATDRGEAIFGMATVKTQVIVVDFENSLAVLSERAKRTAVDGVLFWDSGHNPPSLDKADWTAYQTLLEQYPGAVFVFDTLRSAHSGDENNSEVMTLIMRRMRMLRDAGATVILLHHTPKGNDRQFKGSGAIFDLCDQTLALYQTAKPGSDQEADDDDDAPDKVYRFGTGKKTRYRPHRVFLSFDTEQEIFTLAKNPDDEALEALHAIVCQVDARINAIQTEIVRAAMSDGGFDFGGDKKIRSLLKRGIDRFWTVERGDKNAIIYRPIQFGSLAPLYSTAKLPNRNQAPCSSGNSPAKQAGDGTPQRLMRTEFGSLAKGIYQTGKQAEIEDAEFTEIETFSDSDFEEELPL